MANLALTRGKTDRIQRLACAALWVQTATEARAAGLAHLLGESPLLTPEERDFYRDVMGPDERRHSRICRDLARELGEPEAVRPGIFHEERADLEKVVSMLTVERLFMRGIEQAVAFFGQWGPAFAEGFRLIEREERPHIVHGRAVLRRLARDPEVAAAARRFRGAAVAGFRTELVAPFAEIVGGHREEEGKVNLIWIPHVGTENRRRPNEAARTRSVGGRHLPTPLLARDDSRAGRQL